jgi:carboxymethylenebutenolidase
MGETVEFPSNGNRASGYLARPTSTPAPGLLVLQEWWGLNPQIKGVADRLADEGFIALAPDLYHGELAQHDEMDKASHLMSSLPADRAARDMGGAVDFLLAHDAVAGDAIGAIGFCMGGMLSFVVAAQQGDRIAAIAPFYGAPLGPMEPDWSGFSASVDGHFAENDDFFGPDAVNALAEKLRGMGKDVTITVHPGTGHAFLNEENPLGTYDPDAAKLSWDRSIAFLHGALG